MLDQVIAMGSTAKLGYLIALVEQGETIKAYGKYPTCAL